ncbi:UbiD family decarboxylase [Martelella sp. HB161492]|uniref:UbiD family decarboxylase n=1 Tax=Martelella sp. HB161492 TaxID=2720726 RepID=UPI001590B53D|nr:UbiD family decarboxylase [Martelella sp. HB161492]
MLAPKLKKLSFLPEPRSNSDQSCRSLLSQLRVRSELVVIDEPVDTRFEISALLSLADSRAAVLVNAVTGYDMPVFGNLLSNRDRIALALGIPVDRIQQTLVDAISRPVAPVLVRQAPVQQHLVETDIFARLPVPTFFEHETGPYITAGMIIARDPDTGRGNASFARLKILDKDRAMIGIAPNHHLAIMAGKAAAAGRPLDIAVVLGAHPAIQLAACLYLGLGDDEIECAGALLGEPVRITPARTIDLCVPADAEIVLEGQIHVDQRVKEGPVSEYHGMYEDYGDGFLVSFNCMTCRDDAMLQVIEPGYHGEHSSIAGVPIAAGLKAQLDRVMPNVGAVAVTAAGSGRTNVVVQLDHPRPGQARRAMALCWGMVSIIKNVTVVDSDVDPWDLDAVERAKLNRMKAERDVLIIRDLPADRSEALEKTGMVAKIGYDATIRPDDRSQGFEPARPPLHCLQRMGALLSRACPDLF